MSVDRRGFLAGAAGGVATIFHRDGYRRVQDVEPYLERNKKLQNEPQDRKSELRHIASIPTIFIEKWLREEWERGNKILKWNDPEMNQIIARKLRDPDYAFLRTD